MDINMNGNVLIDNDSKESPPSGVGNPSYAEALRKEISNPQNRNVPIDKKSTDSPPSAVGNPSCTEALSKEISNPQNVEQVNYIDDLNNDVSLSDATTTSEITNSYNEVSELEITNATCESLDNVKGTPSDATLEISNCFSEDLEHASSNARLNEKDLSEMSTGSEVTEEMLPSTKKPETSPLSANDQNGPSNEDDNESSSELSSDDGNDSENDTDSDDGTVNIAHVYPTALKWQLRNNNPKLPETVTVLMHPNNGSKVYLVGTAHFSLESHEDVAKTIQATQPDIVMVELCKSRVNILYLDEKAILEEANNMNFEKIRIAIQQNGFKQGVLYLLLLNMTAHLTKQLGMAPGGEFRRAFLEARQVPECSIQLGDRPIHITFQRALSTLSFWKKMRIAWYMLTNKEPISKEEVERCKQKDLLEEMLSEMTGEFPELSKVFVQERDIYLAYSLQEAAKPRTSHISPTGESPAVVVGVVGIGHVPGIVENWNKVSNEDIPPIISIPKQSTCSKFVYGAVRYSVYGLIAYGCYRLIPRTLLQKPISAVANGTMFCASVIKQRSTKFMMHQS